MNSDDPIRLSLDPLWSDRLIYNLVWMMDNNNNAVIIIIIA